MFDQVTAREFEDERTSGKAFVVIDTRPEDSFESWHAPGAVNVPFGPVESLDDETRARIDELAGGVPIRTICGKGATSTALAAELDADGYEDVAVVKGGMRDWNALYEQARVDTDSDVQITQFQRRGKGCLSYLVVAPDAGEAVVVDPARHVEQYVLAAAEHDAEITHVLDTHIHADHISGGRELADRLGVPYHLGARAEDRGVEFAFYPVEGGDEIRVGDQKITVLDAPGHTSELVVYRVGDDAVLTGDALFLDSVGRTELEFGDDDAQKGAEMAYDTLHDTLLDLPDDITVLPGHVTITNDGRYEHASPGEPVAASLETVRDNLDLAGLDRDAFVDQLVEGDQEEPANYETIIAINTGQAEPDREREATELETGANNCSA